MCTGGWGRGLHPCLPACLLVIVIQGFLLLSSHHTYGLSMDTSLWFLLLVAYTWHFLNSICLVVWRMIQRLCMLQSDSTTESCEDVVETVLYVWNGFSRFLIHFPTSVVGVNLRLLKKRLVTNPRRRVGVPKKALLDAHLRIRSLWVTLFSCVLGLKLKFLPSTIHWQQHYSRVIKLGEEWKQLLN